MGKKKKSTSPQPTVEQNKAWQFDALVVLAISLFSLGFWWLTRYLPFWWHSAHYVIAPANDLFQASSWLSVISQWDFAHPPLLISGLAAAWHLLGTARIVSHLVMLPFLPLLMTASYFLAKKFLPTALAIAAAFLVGLSPIVVSEFSLVYFDLPMAAFATTALALWLHHKHVWSILFFTLAVLTKETAVWLWPLFPLLLLNHGETAPRKDSQRLLVLSFLPLLVIGGWFVLHYQLTGWWFNSGAQASSSPFLSPQVFFSTTGYVFKEFFIQQGRWLQTLLLVLTGITLIAKRQSNTVRTVSLCLWFIAATAWTLLVFVLLQDYSQSYTIMLLPLFVTAMLVLAYHTFNLLLPKSATTWSLVLASACALLLLFHWRPNSEATGMLELQAPSNLATLDLVHIFRQAAKYVELAHPQATVYGSFPEDKQLTLPYLGFVEKPLQFALCQDFSYDPDVEQIVIFHPYSAGATACQQIALDHEATLLQRYEQNGKWLELLTPTSSASATQTLEN